MYTDMVLKNEYSIFCWVHTQSEWTIEIFYLINKVFFLLPKSRNQPVHLQADKKIIRTYALLSYFNRVNRIFSACALKNKMSKFEMIKQLEYLVAFQANCLEKGQWDEFDRLQGSIQKLEKNILHFKGE